MSDTTADTVAAPASGINFRRLLRRHGWTVGVFVLLFGLILYWRSATTVAWGPFDVQTLALDLVPIAFAACAQSVVIISGGIDLSIGSLMALINVCAARFMMNMSFREALLYAVFLVFLGALCGALTGLIIVLTNVADIIVTLSMLFIWYGAALGVLANGGGAPEKFVNLTNADTWFTKWAPAGLVILLVSVGLIWIPVRRSRAGLALYAIGSNRSAAYLAGVNVARARVGAYALGGTFAALGGLAITSGSGGLGDANAGQTSNYTLLSVAAAVLGGVSLLGGVGGLIGPMAAACALSLVPTILVLKGQDPGWATVIQGVLIVAVMMIGGLALRQKGKTGT